MNSEEYSTYTAQAREEKQKTSYRLDAADYQTISQLPVEERLRYFETIVEFVLYDVQPDMTKVSGAMASLAIRKIEDDNRKWLEKCRRNANIKHDADERRKTQKKESDLPFEY